jgi:hypothetical protein
MDAYPQLPAGDPQDPAANPDTDLAGLVDRIRREAGQVLGAISDEEYLRLARISQHNVALQRGHQVGQFHGEALLLAATDGKPEPIPSTAGRWAPHIIGQITEARIACSHSDMGRPENLAQVWDAISAWTDGRNLDATKC